MSTVRCVLVLSHVPTHIHADTRRHNATNSSGTGAREWSTSVSIDDGWCLVSISSM